MSKRPAEVLGTLALPVPARPGFHTALASVPGICPCAGGVCPPNTRRERRYMGTWQAYPQWLVAGDNAWQMTAATFVGLMSLPGLAVLYGGVMQKRWSVNSMMLTFVAFSLVLVAWVLWAFKM